MRLTPLNALRGLLLCLILAGTLLLQNAHAASCTAQSLMTAAERDALSNTARRLIGQVQAGDVQGLRANTIPDVAANFSGIAGLAESLKPVMQGATITVDNMYLLDASTEPAGSARTDFYCGMPIVVFNFNNLPPGKYAFAIVHVTGVPKPRQIALILSETAANRWMLAGFFSNATTLVGHNGLWYWVQARDYAERKMNWNAWLYYQTAAPLLDPVQFLSSPDIGKLQQEAAKVRPADFPSNTPMTVNANGSSFAITSIGTTGELGGLDLEVHYTPNAAQLAELHDPVAARKQAVDIMGALLASHPELHQAFRGIWIRADQGDASVYALDLPMNQISPGTPVPAATLAPASSSSTPTGPGSPLATYHPTQAEIQPSLTVDRDPVLTPDAVIVAPAVAGSSTPAGRAGEIQKGKNGIYTLHEDVNEVVLNCTVVDEKGQLVRGLKRGDFQVWEDNVLQTIESFQFQDLPVSMGILVDNSGSMRDKRAAVDAAALDLVKASNPKDAAFIVNFSDKAYLDQDFTSNVALLEQGLSHFDSRNTTALYDAVAASVDELAQHATQPKQVLLIITDGADNASRLTLHQAVQRVQRLGGPVVYSIGLLYGDDKDEAQQAKTALETLSRETGGIAYFPNSLQDVDEIAGEVARDIRDQYTVGYHSTRAASLGGFRRVRVEAKDPDRRKENLIVRTQTGYYPNAARHDQPTHVAQAAQAAK